MLNKWILTLLLLIGVFSNTGAFAAKHKAAKKQTVHASAKHVAKTNKRTKVTAKKSSKLKGKKGKKGNRATKDESVTTNEETNSGSEKTISAPLQLIAQNKEKTRISDSLHKNFFAGMSKEVDEGYFASSFAAQKKASSFQTIEGTAAVFKSVSGWEDKKFYVLTNQLPVGTLVRITTADLKSICAKVINVLPEVGTAIQYRLNDAAAAILGINNKTFPVSITY